MPFVKSIKVENGVLGIWKLSETSEELQKHFQFSPNENNEYQKFTGERRKTEYLATRLLLQEILKQKFEITRLESGKPLIKNSNLNISISHSADFVTVLVSEKNIGIDVENLYRNIDRVAERFLHKDELEWINKSEKEQYLKILFWGAKEAIFKCSNQAGVQFHKQIFIPAFEFSKSDYFYGTLSAENRNEKYKLWYFSIENNIVVYCVEE